MTKVKPEDLTDATIREHMERLERLPYIGANQRLVIREGIADCATALGANGREACVDRGYSITPHQRDGARRRIAAAINARKEKP